MCLHRQFLDVGARLGQLQRVDLIEVFGEVGRAGDHVRDIAANPWIVPQAHLPMRSLLEQLFEDADLTFPAYAIETSSTFATLSLLRAGDGTIGMIPLQVARYFADCGLIGILPIEITRTGAPYGIATRRGATLTQPVQMFIDICRGRVGA